MAKKKTPDKIIIEVVPRTVFGKKLRKLRYTGVIPANIFGTDFKSTAITVNYKEFIKTYRLARNTLVVYLTLEKEEIPVLIKNVQTHPVTDSLLHVDFRKINLKQKIITEVPVKTTGQSEAISLKGGVLLTQMAKLSVEALPQDIPQIIEVDISSIKEIGQEIKVADLKKSALFTIKDEPNKTVISVIAHKEESITPETVAATPEVITEKAPVEGEVVSEPGKITPQTSKSPTGKQPAAKPGTSPEKPVEKKK